MRTPAYKRPQRRKSAAERFSIKTKSQWQRSARNNLEEYEDYVERKHVEAVSLGIMSQRDADAYRASRENNKKEKVK